MNMEITRQQFIDAVEAGINRAGNGLNDTERALLRHVARTESRTTYGAFRSRGLEPCFCPLSASGIADGSQTTGKYDQFYLGYDAHMRGVSKAAHSGFGGGGLVYDVVG